MGAVNDDVLNLVYNLADFVNKIAFAWPFGLVPRAAPWSRQSQVYSSADYQASCLGYIVFNFGSSSHAACRRPCPQGQSMHFSLTYLGGSFFQNHGYFVVWPHMIQTFTSGIALG